MTTYRWGRCPGPTWTPAGRVIGYDWHNTLWRRSRVRVAWGWVLYWGMLSWLVWLCAN